MDASLCEAKLDSLLEDRLGGLVRGFATVTWARGVWSLSRSGRVRFAGVAGMLLILALREVCEWE
jgi:hypothetical protein